MKRKKRRSGEKREKRERDTHPGTANEQLYYFQDVTTSVEDPEISVLKPPFRKDNR